MFPGRQKRTGRCMAVILCYGDSNTHGTMPMRGAGVSERHPKMQRWPEVMARRLGPAHDVISEGLPGRTTVHDDPVEGGERSGIKVLPAILHSHKPIDLMVLMLGTNDLKPRFSVTAHETLGSDECRVHHDHTTTTQSRFSFYFLSKMQLLALFLNFYK